MAIIGMDIHRSSAAIAYARAKTDKIDAAVLARLRAGGARRRRRSRRLRWRLSNGFLSEVWVADEDTQRRCRQTAERVFSSRRFGQRDGSMQYWTPI